MTEKPYRPGNDEVKYYYFGLASDSRLIARSSTKVWTPPFWDAEDTMQTLHIGSWTGYGNKAQGKYFRPVGPHPRLHTLWNDARSSLRLRIIDALQHSACAKSWKTLDIFRIGLQEVHRGEGYYDKRPQEFPIVALISVAPSSDVSWEQGVELAQACKRIFSNHNILDVECEIRAAESWERTKAEKKRIDEDEAEEAIEAKADRDIAIANAKGVTDAGFKLSAKPPDEDEMIYDIELSDRLGAKVATLAEDSRPSCKSLYLAVSSSTRATSPIIVALTARSSLLGDNARNSRLHQRKENSPNPVIQIDAKTINESLNYAILCRHIEQRQAMENDKAQSQQGGSVESNEAVISCLSAIINSESRIIGEVLYSPPLGLVKSAHPESGGDWLANWALFTLHKESHEAPLSELRNIFHLYEDQKRLADIVKRHKSKFPGLNHIARGKITTKNCLELSSDFVPLAEILDTGSPRRDQDERTRLATVVAMCGDRPDLPVGLGSTLESLRRYDLAGDQEDGSQTGNTQIGAAWPIISIEGCRGRFSRDTIAGTTVFDLGKFRPAAMLEDMTGTPGDIAYAQIFDGRILSHMAEQGWTVSAPGRGSEDRMKNW